MRYVLLLVMASIGILLHAQVPSYVPSDGLVGWWPFDGNANDLSGSGNDGTAVNVTETEDRFGNPNSAYYFNGSSGFVDVGNDPSIKRFQTSFTISAWVLEESGAQNFGRTIVSNRNSSVGGSKLGVRDLNVTGIENHIFLITDGTVADAVESNIPLSIGTWRHVCVVFEFNGGNSNEVSFYIDRVNQSGFDLIIDDVPDPQLESTRIGYELPGAPNDYFWHGKIDEVGMWNRALTPTEIEALFAGSHPTTQIPNYVPINGLVGWWPFNGNALDESGYGNNGTVSGAMLTPDRFGNADAAYDFDGIADYIEVVHTTSQNLANSVSFSLWIIPNDFSLNNNSSRVPLGKMINANVLGLGFETLDGVGTCCGPQFYIYNGGVALQYEDPVPISITEWTHLVGTYGEDTLKLYANGEMVGSSVGAKDLSTTIQSLYFGKEGASTNRHFKGRIDDIAFWNRSLATDEVEALYIGQPPTCQPGTPCDDGDPVTINDMFDSNCVCSGTNANIQVAAKVLLEGPYNQGNSLMDDVLRSSGLVPLLEPYTALGYFHVGSGGDELTTPAVLSVNGANAIVDWVILEIRDQTANIRLDSRSALLQRDGDIVDVDGMSPVTFGVGPGTYYLTVKHRNHLGIMTGLPVAMGGSVFVRDFTQSSTGVYGANARKSVGSAQMLWAGDATGNGQVKYTGASNDRDRILSFIGSTTPNNVVVGYHREDVDMNGQVKYTGSGNDRDIILQNIGSTSPNTVRNAQVP